MVKQWKHDDKHKNHTQVHESTVDLSVLHMTEQKENQRRTLICSVVTFDSCRYKVKWFHQDVDNNETPPAETDCSATVTLSSGSKLPQCNLTDTVTGEVFTFSLQSSGNPATNEATHASGVSPTSVTTKTTPEQNSTNQEP
ncbi:hypothetical protein AMECASPLE_034808 [Ameca splendens]|uniref:Ig-like domain-containing protein n=1 Tax=Ameca splendens TaxID=208324 RepID=A0ABV0XK70_9TELE